MYKEKKLNKNKSSCNISSFFDDISKILVRHAIFCLCNIISKSTFITLIHIDDNI